MNWVAGLDDAESLIPRLITLGASALNDLNIALNLKRLKQALEVWDANTENPDEEFWQTTLTEHSFVLEQVFSWPTTVVKDKAYVGGKSVLNTGGNIVDFLVSNYFTSNAALVEIKTPATRLLHTPPYRNGVYNASDDLAGSVMQVLNYRFNLQREFFSLQHGLPGAFETFEPRCVVIVGKTGELNSDEDKARSLELYRGHSLGVAVITFDDLFEKTRRLIAVMESSTYIVIREFAAREGEPPGEPRLGRSLALPNSARFGWGPWTRWNCRSSAGASPSRIAP